MSDIVKNGSTASTSVIVNKVEKPDLGEVSNELLTLLDLKESNPQILLDTSIDEIKSLFDQMNEIETKLKRERKERRGFDLHLEQLRKL